MAQERAQAVIAVMGETNMIELGDKISRSVGKIAKSSDKAAKGTDKIAASLKKAKKGWDDVAGGLNHVTDLMGKALGLARDYVDATRSVAKAGASSRAFERMEGGIAGAAKSMERLNTAVSGGVAKSDLQRSATLARRAGLDLTQTATLFELANKASMETGESATELVERFTQAIADRSDGVFKAMGVEVDFGQAIFEVTDRLNLQTDDLTEAQKRIAVYDQTVKGLTKTFGDVPIDEHVVQANKIEASWRDIEVRIKGAAVELVNFFTTSERFRDAPEGSTDAGAKRASRGGPTSGASGYSTGRGVPRVRLSAGVKQAIAAEEARAEAVKKTTVWAREQWQAMIDLRIAEEKRGANMRKGVDLIRKRADQTFALAMQQAKYASEIGSTSIAIQKFGEAAGAAGIDIEKIQQIQDEIFKVAPWKEHAESAELYATAAKIAAGHTDLQADAMREMIRQGYAWVDVERSIGKAAVDMRNKMADALGIARQFAATGVPGWASGPGKKPTRGRRRKQKQNKGLYTTQSGEMGWGTEDDRINALRNESPALEMQAALQKFATDKTKADRDRNNEAVQERTDAMVQAYERLQEIQGNVSRGALDMSESFAMGMGGAAAAVANASDIIVSQFGQISESMELMEKMGKSSTDAFVANVPAMLSAGGQLVAGFIEDQQARAAVMAVFELASSIASFAAQDYTGGAMHAAAAVMYGLVAGGLGASGGTGAGASSGQSTRPSMPSVGVRRDDARSQTFSVQINMTGATIIGSDKRRLKNDLASILAEASQSLPPGGFQPS